MRSGKPLFVFTRPLPARITLKSSGVRGRSLVQNHCGRFHPSGSLKSLRSGFRSSRRPRTWPGGSPAPPSVRSGPGGSGGPALGSLGRGTPLSRLVLAKSPLRVFSLTSSVTWEVRVCWWGSQKEGKYCTRGCFCLFTRCEGSLPSSDNRGGENRKNNNPATQG